MMDLTLLIPELVCLAFGIATILVVINAWKPHKANWLMVSFLVASFVIKPVFEIGFLLVSVMQVIEDFKLLQILFYLPGIVNVLGTILLLAYILMRTHEASEPTLIPTVDFPASTSPTSSIRLGNDHASLFGHIGPAWNTERPDPSQSFAIIRKREWALILDCAPGLITICGGFALVTAGVNGGISVEAFFLFLPFVILGFVVYIVMKDCNRGLSLGKWISGCRVVDFTTGRPIGLGQSLARNILLLIPFWILVELLTVNIRADKRRLGDLLANTIVVTGSPASINGHPVEFPEQTTEPESPKAHPLDD